MENDYLMEPFEVPEVFTDRECVQMIQAEGTFVQAGVVNYTSHEQKMGGETRRSKKKAIAPTPQNAWIFQRLNQVVQQLNQKYYQFQLEDLESTQVLSYGPGDFFNWHVDMGAGMTSRRKLSIVVFLSKPRDYEGGELIWVPSTKRLSYQQGALVLFPSYLMHQVKPVISGKRYTLVSWVIGRPFS